MDAGGRDVATLARHEYEVLGTAQGRDKTTRVFVLWFPVGQHKSPAEVWDSAYYDAVRRVEDCDGLLLPRARTKRIVIPLLLVNVIVKRTDVAGRCIRIKTDEELAAEHRAGGHPHHGKGHGHRSEAAGRHGRGHGAGGKGGRDAAKGGRKDAATTASPSTGAPDADGP